MNTKKNYITFLFSIGINNFGDVLFDLFIVWKITQQSGDVLSAVYLIGSSIVFRALLALFIGILVDKQNKKRLILFSNISSAVIILLFALSYNFVLNHIWLGIIFILMNDINNEIFGRSYTTLTAELFDEHTFVKFQATSTILRRVISIAGAGLVGFLMAVVPDQYIFFLDILTFALCALLVWTVPYQYQKIKSTKPTRQVIPIFKEIGGDIKYLGSIIFKTPFIFQFILIMFILNFAYGYIPYILPVAIADQTANSVLLGFMKSAIAVGEIIGLLLVSKYGRHVSRLFKVSMIGNALCMLLLLIVQSSYAILLLFAAYGILDSITQPLFSYTITMMDERDRGKILGGIDAIILLSPSIGMYVITKAMAFRQCVGYFLLAGIFLTAFFIMSRSRELGTIKISSLKRGI